MYSVVLLAALTSGEAAPQHGFKKGYVYGACYGGCYGVCYAGWNGFVHAVGGWGLPYGGYFAGYGGCGALAGIHYGAGPFVYTPPTGYATPEMKPADEGKPAEKGKKSEEQPQGLSRAQVTFRLPPGAKLYVDDVAIPDADVRKQFRTPALRRGEEYYYELRVEVVRDGKPLTQTKRITLRAGDDIRADFSSLGAKTDVADSR